MSIDESPSVRSSEGGRPVALVLAGSRGLGRGAALELARDGWSVAVCARSPEAVAAVVEELTGLGAPATGAVADVTRPDDLARLFGEVRATLGTPRALVVNAGGPPPGRFDDLDDDAWMGAVQSTLMSAVRAIRLGLVGMRELGGGRIVVIGSSSVKAPIDGLLLSNAMRPALVGLVKTLARELAPEQITANLVSPGRVDTDRVRMLDARRAERDGVTPEVQRARSEAGIPAGRYGTPEEVGALVAFLCSARASYVTGQSVLADGGMVAALP